MSASEARDYTVAALFDRARALLRTPETRPHVRITFDRRYHFPRTIEYDDPNSIDDEGFTRVTTFEVRSP